MAAITEFSESDAILALTSSSYRQFSFLEIKKATNNFDGSSLFSRFGSDLVEYVGNIVDLKSEESTLAYVKRFSKSAEGFRKEICRVMKIQAHTNLISLIGYCIESNEKILVFEYMQNGSLVHYQNNATNKIWSWKKRVEICLQVGYALQHLHRSTSEFPFGLSHGSVYSSDILLDENWNTKISNFNNTKISTIEDYFHKPEDVSQFGFLLIQVLRWDTIFYRGFHQKYKYYDFEVWVQKEIALESAEELSPDSVKAFSDAIRKCLEPDQFKRATIDEVVLDLEVALKFQDPQPIPTTLYLLDSSSTRESMLIRAVESESLDDNNEATNKPEIKIMAGSSSSSQFSSSFSSISLFSSCQRFSLDEIKKATNNFDLKKCLGKGGEGIVYRAEISLDGKTEKSVVAVKHLHNSLTDQFEKEIVTIAKFRHPNIVSLLGYCQESYDNVLIYEYMEKGNLSKYVKKNSKFCLSWKQRLNICLGAAKGLQLLHKKTKEFPKGIIHRDVKPENILINKNWVAKVSDFGLIKLSNISQKNSTMVTLNLKGTPGYFAPETLKGKISKKSDVYAFGFLMFEVICRKKRWDISEGQSIYPTDEDDIGLLVEENVDVEIKDQISNCSRRLFIDVIVECMQSKPIRRPTMDKVVKKLEQALKY